MEVDPLAIQIAYLESIAIKLGVPIQDCKGDIGGIVSRIEKMTNAMFAQGLFNLTSNPPLSIVDARVGLNRLISTSGFQHQVQSSPLVGIIKGINIEYENVIHWSRKTEVGKTKLVGKDRHGARGGTRGTGRHSVTK